SRNSRAFVVRETQPPASRVDPSCQPLRDVTPRGVAPAVELETRVEDTSPSAIRNLRSSAGLTAGRDRPDGVGVPAVPSPRGCFREATGGGAAPTCGGRRGG